MANIIAVGTTQASNSFTLVATDVVRLQLVPAVGSGLQGCSASVQAKASNNETREIFVLDANNSTCQLSGPGDFTIVRNPSVAGCGVDKT